MKSGTGPTRLKFKDYGYFETHGKRLEQKYGSLGAIPSHPEFPSTLGRKITLVPNQNIDDPAFSPVVVAEPYGCTNESQTAAGRFLTGNMIRPDFLEALTNANARGGYDVRKSLDWCLPPNVLNPKRLGIISGYDNVRPKGGLDWFEAIKVAIMDGLPEFRVVSIGSPWFVEYGRTGTDGILPTPASFNTIFATWHNWIVFDWLPLKDQSYLACLSWQGPSFGNVGVHYISRAHFNRLMSITGCVAFVATQQFKEGIQTIDASTMEWLQSLMRYIISLAPFAYGIKK